ncbi:piggyBac transposable element-derived protein 3-like [Gymnodraco acuticeps]|uniref:PiggyBac transposable element-derived protein 3-like n=1 Tax=Gymnodraco acuticeps TaxID=8218 RepID=A0A6P8W6J8_GYMAC|nr:piggyBac transposable element-derived protein 3-like [Gymnodraco acuticeps]
MATNSRDHSSGSSKYKPRQERFSVQQTLELLGLIDGDNSDLEDLSDNDDPILDVNYQPPPQEQSSSEDEDDSSDDEDPIPQPTEHSRGRKRLRGANNGSGSGSGTGTGSSRTPRRRRQTQQIEADRSDDDSEEPTPGPSTQGQPNKGRGLRWRATPLTPDLAQFEHEDDTELDRNGWTPLDYFQQYIDRDLMKMISDCSNAMSLSRSGDPLNTSVDEVYHFFGACILMSCIRYPTIRMYWSKALRITAITDKFTRNRFFRLRGSIKVLIDDDVPEDLRKRDTFWKVRPFLDRILQGCKSQNRPECASIDEQMIPFTGACPCRQYLPMKPNPVGIKNFVCATADGIVLDFDLYQGKGALLEQVEEEEVGLGLGGLVLARLCQTLHRGTKVYCDRFFTSIRCVEQIMKKEMYITGTIMKNRLAGAKEKLASDKTMKNTGRGTSSELSTEDGKLCVVKWYDNKPVLMMSVVHGTEPEDTCQRWDKKLKEYVTVSRPSIVREYNLKMGGVDLIDRMISYYRMSARTKKWTMRMLMHFTDLALANSWLLYRKDLAICAAPKKSIMQFLEFRTEMAMTLLAQHHGQGSDADLSEQSEEEDNSNQGKKRSVTAVPHVSVRRRANAHLPEMISLKNAARCRVAGCTGRTRVRCVTCKVFLCLQGDRNCYTAFHTAFHTCS